MDLLLDVWHDLTPAQGTLLGGAFVLFAGIACVQLWGARPQIAGQALVL